LDSTKPDDVYNSQEFAAIVIRLIIFCKVGRVGMMNKKVGAEKIFSYKYKGNQGKNICQYEKKKWVQQQMPNKK
jgi:hypothetical protein